MCSFQNTGGCYPPRPKASEDNTLLDLQNSSRPKKAKFNNCFIIYSKYFPDLKGVSIFRSLFSAQQKWLSISEGKVPSSVIKLEIFRKKQPKDIASYADSNKIKQILGSLFWGKIP